MRGSFTIGRLFGIQVRIHWLFFLLPAIVAVPPILAGHLDAALASLLGVLLLFGFVLLHEFGHSLAAKRLGIPVLDITLWPLGGLARLGRMPERPSAELFVAVAGPFVNLLLAGIFAWPAILGGADLWREATRLAPTTLSSFCVIANLYMAVFNFIPAFPMDGGRVLRALLGYRMGFVRATRTAVRVGRLFAYLFIGFGLLEGHWMLAMIGFFVLVIGSQEERNVRWRAVLEEMRSRGLVIDGQARPIDPEDEGESRG